MPAGGFTPGTILQGRYRIIGLLGRGGMGEVYRADDLKLGQAVALKFLPSALADDPVRRERFFAEVRITRQVSHPNICRVYDIAEIEEPAEGGARARRYFLTMEYIDGEDLASLLQRIGYLANEKALDLARQLIAGLAAAHERGVLHRDLKPANIMVDGRGRVRITDFGLAIAASDEAQATDAAGTPVYMAPEQLAGKGATVRSDIYALGLVLYELCTGKRVFTATTLPELREQKENTVPTAPSDLRPGIDPVVERVIQRCLERDPRARPASAVQVAASLPGGDPLAAALAAGETPSPEMVAASGLKEGLRPVVAVALLLSFVVMAMAVIAMNSRVMLLRQVRLDKPPEALADRAQELLKQLGSFTAAADRASGFDFNNDFLRYVGADARSRRAHLRSFVPLTYWYRQSPQALQRVRGQVTASVFSFGVTNLDPPLRLPGEVRIHFDGAGRLYSFEAIPPEIDAGSGPNRAVDWTPMFAAAGLDPSMWAPSDPQANPNYYADTRDAWEGFLPDAPNVPLRIEAAAYRGRPVSFFIIGPWTASLRSPVRQMTMAERVGGIGLVLVVAGVIGAALFFAVANLRIGRGDRRGALRVAAVVLGLSIISWILKEHHVAGFGELYLFVTFVSPAVAYAGLVWILYIALEPMVRRRWPQLLVTWTRLSAGEWRDPQVSRDVLIGCVAGLAIQMCAHLILLVSGGLDLPVGTQAIEGTGVFLAMTFHLARFGIIQALALLFLLAILRTVLRHDWAAFAVFVALLLFVPLTVPDASLSTSIAIGLVSLGGWLLVLVRFGLVSLAAGNFISSLFQSYPMTFEASAWYAGYGYAALAIAIGIVLYAAKTSLGGRRVFEAADV